MMGCLKFQLDAKAAHRGSAGNLGAHLEFFDSRRMMPRFNGAWQKCLSLTNSSSAENPENGGLFKQQSDHRFEPPSQAASHFFDIHFLSRVSLQGPI
jgi:hypothetical protein